MIGKAIAEADALHAAEMSGLSLFSCNCTASRCGACFSPCCTCKTCIKFFACSTVCDQHQIRPQALPRGFANADSLQYASLIWLAVKDVGKLGAVAEVGRLGV
jgi:hypothetical protein